MNRIRTIEWQVAGACNYDCTYCIQSKRYRRGRPQLAQIERALATFAALPGVWEIKCSGGEAFAHPLFMKRIVPRRWPPTAETCCTPGIFAGFPSCTKSVEGWRTIRMRPRSAG